MKFKPTTLPRLICIVCQLFWVSRTAVLHVATGDVMGAAAQAAAIYGRRDHDRASCCGVRTHEPCHEKPKTAAGIVLMVPKKSSRSKLIEMKRVELWVETLPTR